MTDKIMNIIPEIKEGLDISYVKNLNPSALSFVGDSVQTLYVKAKLILLHDENKSGVLHKLSAMEINARNQAIVAESLIKEYNELELEIYKKGRNYGGGTSKNATLREYRKASGLEAVFGFLYLTKQSDRLLYLLNLSDNIK